MTSARYNAWRRLLKGIELMEEINLRKIRQMTKLQRDLNAEMQGLVRLIGDAQYADTRLLFPMSRRIGNLAEQLKSLDVDMTTANQKRLRHQHAKDILAERVRAYSTHQFENEMMESVMSKGAQPRGVQPAARHSL